MWPCGHHAVFSRARLHSADSRRLVRNSQNSREAGRGSLRPAPSHARYRNPDLLGPHPHSDRGCHGDSNPRGDCADGAVATGHPAMGLPHRITTGMAPAGRTRKPRATPPFSCPRFPDTPPRYLRNTLKFLKNPQIKGRFQAARTAGGTVPGTGSRYGGGRKIQ